MHELKLMDIQKKYKDKEAVRKFNYTFTNGVYGLLFVMKIKKLLSEMEKGEVLCTN